VTGRADNEALCPVYHRAVELIGRRWTGAIVRVLLNGAERFSDIGAAIPGLTDRMLSERLKELEMEGIVIRRVLPETPVRIEYHLTEKGRALGSVLDGVAAWAHAWSVETGHGGNSTVAGGGPRSRRGQQQARDPSTQ
jgi:DNA-binding HxlR family transcriptional regulator